MSALPARIALAAACGSRLTIFTSFTGEAVFLEHPGQREVGEVPGALAATVLPFEVAIFAMPGLTTMPSAP